MKHYAVKSGRQVGVYSSWNECKTQVNGYKGAQYKAFPTMEQALIFIGDNNICPQPIESQHCNPSGGNSQHFNPSVGNSQHFNPVGGNTQHFNPVGGNSQHFNPSGGNSLHCNPSGGNSQHCNPSGGNSQHFNPVGWNTQHFNPVGGNTQHQNVLYVDGGQNRQTGNDAWGCVVDGSGNDILALHSDILSDMHLMDVVLPVGKRKVIVANFLGTTQQNNGAELLSLIAGLRIAINTSNIKTIFSDSDLCVKYWSVALGNKQRLSFDQRKVKFIDNLIDLRKKFESIGGSIVKIGGEKNLADLGYHTS